MNPFRTGKLVLFQVTYDRDWHFFEIIFFVVLGIFGVSAKFRISSLSHHTSGFVWSLCCQIQPSSGRLSSKVPG